MKRIFLVLVVFLIGHGPAIAGELKVMVPVDDFKQMSARLETLEQENSRLKQVVNSGAPVADSGQETMALQSRLNSLEQENNRLKLQVQSPPAPAAEGQASADLAARISVLEQKNGQLQQQLAEMRSQEKAAGSDARLAEVTSENSQLKQQVQSLKEGGLAAAMLGDKSSARHLYATGRHVGTFHNFKF